MSIKKTSTKKSNSALDLELDGLGAELESVSETSTEVAVETKKAPPIPKIQEEPIEEVAKRTPKREKNSIMNIVAQDFGTSNPDSKYANLVTIKPVKQYKRTDMANNVSVIPGAKKVLAPYSDKYGNLITGHTPAECEEYQFAIIDMDFWRNFRVVLTDTKKILNIAKEQDLLEYKFLKAHFRVANSPSEITSNTRYVMLNEEEEAVKKTKSFELKVKAMAYLNDLSIDQRSDFLKLFDGRRTNALKPTVIFSKLAERAEVDPQGFIKAFEDTDRSTRVRIVDLEQHDIIRKDGMSFYYGEELLGANLDQTILWFKTPKNQEMIAQFISMLNEKKRIL